MNEKSKIKEQQRIEVVNQYLKGLHIIDICTTYGCSRGWFYKWYNRYKTADPEWFKEKSRAPLKVTHKTDIKMEQTIIDTRKKLMKTPYAQYGPQAISYAISKTGITPPPVWTISRVVNRNHLIRKKSKTYLPKGKVYPYSYVLCHQMDLIGPRYLSSKARFYFHTIICCDTHIAGAFVLDNQKTTSVCNCLVKFWKNAGIPNYLQMDNFLAFWGSLNKPNALGKLIRLCLSLGITPVFIPTKEPWRNGIIEHFNRTLQSAVLTAEHYKHTCQLQTATDQFCQFHNQHHNYSTQGGLTPVNCQELLEYPIQCLPSDYEFPVDQIPLSEGEIHVIRFIRSNLKFTIFGLSYDLPDNVMYEYVRGIIITHEQRLLIFKERELITEFLFPLY